MSIAYVNGEFLPIDDATVPMQDRAHQFADGVYEVIAFFNRKLLDAEPHLKRLDYSCRELRILNPYSHDEWLEVIHRLIEQNRFVHGGIYLQVSRGTQARSHVFKENLTPNVSLSVFGQKTPSKTLTESGAAAITHPDLRWKRCDIKTTGLLGNVLAKQAATDAGVYEAILIKDNGDISEASISNFFIVKDQVIYTHPSTHEILSGIARSVTVEIAQKRGYKVSETPFNVSTMMGADEAFLTGTTTNILPVVTIDGHSIGNGKPGDITLELLEGFIQHIEQQTGYRLWS